VFKIKMSNVDINVWHFLNFVLCVGLREETDVLVGPHLNSEFLGNSYLKF
jgi:hypothetical protein